MGPRPPKGSLLGAFGEDLGGIFEGILELFWIYFERVPGGFCDAFVFNSLRLFWICWMKSDVF